MTYLIEEFINGIFGLCLLLLLIICIVNLTPQKRSKS